MLRKLLNWLGGAELSDKLAKETHLRYLWATLAIAMIDELRMDYAPGALSEIHGVRAIRKLRSQVALLRRHKEKVLRIARRHYAFEWNTKAALEDTGLAERFPFGCDTVAVVCDALLGTEAKLDAANARIAALENENTTLREYKRMREEVDAENAKVLGEMVQAARDAE